MKFADYELILMENIKKKQSLFQETAPSFN